MKVNNILIRQGMDCDNDIWSMILFDLATHNSTPLQNKHLFQDKVAFMKKYSLSRWYIDHYEKRFEFSIMPVE